MAFRYEIWKFIEPHPTNTDIFFIKNYAKFADLTPNDVGFSLQVEKEETQEYYRIKSSGSLIFYNDDFDLMKDIYDSCDGYILKVFDDCPNSVRSSFIKSLFFNEADFIGFIRPRSMEMDYDMCSCTLNPDVFDSYTKFLRNWDTKENVFTLVNKAWVGGIHFSEETEFSVREYETIDEPDPYAGSLGAIQDCLTAPFAMGIRTKIEWTLKKGTYFVKDTYAREYKYFDFETYEVIIDGVPTLVYGRLPLCAEKIDNGKTWYATTITNGDTQKFVRSINGLTLADLTSGSMYVAFENGYTLNVLGNGTAHRGILLNSIIKELRKKSDLTTGDYGQPEYKTISNFLFSKDNPIDAHTPNRFEQIVMMQKSDAKNTSDPSTKLELSLKDLIDIVTYFNLAWHISENQVLRIEHKLYYDNGLSYDLNKNKVYLYNVPKNDLRRKVKYKDDVPPSQDLFVLQDSVNKDFVGYPIVYAQGCAGDEKRELAYNITTDVSNVILSNPSEIGNDGVLILHTKEEPYTFMAEGNVVINDFKFVIQNGIGVASTKSFPNAELSTANIQDFLWRHSRPTKEGKLNNHNVTFETISYDKYIDAIPIRIGYKSINPYLLIGTEMGDSKISSASYNPKDRKWNAVLQYKEVTYE
jgi:hypothetical protein